MYFELQYEPVQFQATVYGMKAEFPTLQESVAIGLDEEIVQLTDLLIQTPDEKMERLAYALKSKDIEILVHAFACVSEPVLLKKMEFVIRKRFRRKLFHLGWVLMQRDYTNDGLLYGMKLLLELMGTERAGSGKTDSEATDHEGVSSRGADSQSVDHWSVSSEGAGSVGMDSEALNQGRESSGGAGSEALNQRRVDSGGAGSERSEDEVVALLKGLSGTADEYLAAVSERLCVKGTSVKRFFSRYSIIEDSLFGSSLLEQFFLFCDKEDFIANAGVLMKYFHQHNDNVSLLSCYLDKFETESYSQELLGEVLAKWGVPGDDSDFWREMSPRHREKVNAWMNYKAMERHFGSRSRDFKVWVPYFHLLQKVIHNEEAGFAAMDFGEFAAVDLKYGDRGAYLYHKELFQQEVKQFNDLNDDCEEMKGWRPDPAKVGELRDLYLYGTESPIYRIRYDKANILYIKDMLKKLTDTGATFDVTVEDGA